MVEWFQLGHYYLFMQWNQHFKTPIFLERPWIKISCQDFGLIAYWHLELPIGHQLIDVCIRTSSSRWPTYQPEKVCQDPHCVAYYTTWQFPIDSGSRRPGSWNRREESKSMRTAKAVQVMGHWAELIEDNVVEKRPIRYVSWHCSRLKTSPQKVPSYCDQMHLRPSTTTSLWLVEVFWHKTFYYYVFSSRKLQASFLGRGETVYRYSTLPQGDSRDAKTENSWAAENVSHKVNCFSAESMPPLHIYWDTSHDIAELRLCWISFWVSGLSQL